MASFLFGQPNVQVLQNAPDSAQNSKMAPPPKFAEFKFKTIGQEPQLLKRFTAPNPEQQYHDQLSSSPSTSPHVNNQPLSEEIAIGDAVFRSRPTLLQALADPKSQDRDITVSNAANDDKSPFLSSQTLADAENDDHEPILQNLSSPSQPSSPSRWLPLSSTFPAQSAHSYHESNLPSSSGQLSLNVSTVLNDDQSHPLNQTGVSSSIAGAHGDGNGINGRNNRILNSECEGSTPSHHSRGNSYISLDQQRSRSPQNSPSPSWGSPAHGWGSPAHGWGSSAHSWGSPAHSPYQRMGSDLPSLQYPTSNHPTSQSPVVSFNHLQFPRPTATTIASRSTSPIPVVNHETSYTVLRALQARLLSAISSLQAPDASTALLLAQSASSQSTTALDNAHKAYTLAQQSLTSAQESFAAAKESLQAAENAQARANEVMVAVEQIQSGGGKGQQREWEWKETISGLNNDVQALGEWLREREGEEARMRREKEKNEQARRDKISLENAMRAQRNQGAQNNRVTRYGTDNDEETRRVKRKRLEESSVHDSEDKQRTAEIEADVAQRAWDWERERSASRNEHQQKSAADAEELLRSKRQTEQARELELHRGREADAQKEAETMAQRKRELDERRLEVARFQIRQREEQEEAAKTAAEENQRVEESAKRKAAEIAIACQEEHRQQELNKQMEEEKRAAVEVKAREDALRQEQEKKRQVVMMQKQRASAEAAAKIRADRAREKLASNGSLPGSTSSISPSISPPDISADHDVPPLHAHVSGSPTNPQFGNVVAKTTHISLTTKGESKAKKKTKPISGGTKLGSEKGASLASASLLISPKSPQAAAPDKPHEIMPPQSHVSLSNGRTENGSSSVRDSFEHPSPSQTLSQQNEYSEGQPKPGSEKRSQSLPRIEHISESHTPTGEFASSNRPDVSSTISVYRQCQDAGNLPVVPKSQTGEVPSEAHKVNLRFVMDANEMPWDPAIVKSEIVSEPAIPKAPHSDKNIQQDFSIAVPKNAKWGDQKSQSSSKTQLQKISGTSSRPSLSPTLPVKPLPAISQPKQKPTTSRAQVPNSSSQASSSATFHSVSVPMPTRKVIKQKLTYPLPDESPAFNQSNLTALSHDDANNFAANYTPQWGNVSLPEPTSDEVAPATLGDSGWDHPPAHQWDTYESNSYQPRGRDRHRTVNGRVRGDHYSPPSSGLMPRRFSLPSLQPLITSPTYPKSPSETRPHTPNFYDTPPSLAGKKRFRDSSYAEELPPAQRYRARDDERARENDRGREYDTVRWGEPRANERAHSPPSTRPALQSRLEQRLSKDDQKYPSAYPADPYAVSYPSVDYRSSDSYSRGLPASEYATPVQPPTQPRERFKSGGRPELLDRFSDSTAAAIRGKAVTRGSGKPRGGGRGNGGRQLEQRISSKTLINRLEDP